MPPGIYNQMQTLITLALKALRGHNDLPIWLKISQGNRKPIISAPDNWQSDYAHRLSATRFMMSARTSAPKHENMISTRQGYLARPMLIGHPLNLTMFFRILSTIHDHGYPAHWLADVFFSILNNQVYTTVRPPRSFPHKITELKKDFANNTLICGLSSQSYALLRFYGCPSFLSCHRFLPFC
jgi:hypothetical protein